MLAAHAWNVLPHLSTPYDVADHNPQSAVSRLITSSVWAPNYQSICGLPVLNAIMRTFGIRQMLVTGRHGSVFYRWNCLWAKCNTYNLAVFDITKSNYLEISVVPCRLFLLLMLMYVIQQWFDLNKSRPRLQWPCCRFDLFGWNLSEAPKPCGSQLPAPDRV